VTAKRSLAPEERRMLDEITRAFESTLTRQARRCARGDHRFPPGAMRCWGCDAPRLYVVDGAKEKRT
jgi:hypothetical protein